MFSKRYSREKFQSSITKKIFNLGLTNIKYELWYTYIGVINRTHPLFNTSSRSPEEFLIYDTLLKSKRIHIESHSFRKSNKALIIVNGVDYSANCRGLNFVVIEADDLKILDSFCVDLYEYQYKFIRKKVIQC